MRAGRFAAGVLLILSGVGGFFYWQHSRLERSQDVPIKQAAQRYHVEPALIKAIVWRESRFHPEARGRSGELGLMQIREDAAREWADAEKIPGYDHPHCLDPVTNTLAGTFYFRKLLKRYSATDNPLPYALADYNAGRGNVIKWNSGSAATNSADFVGQIGFPSTREYVIAVMDRYQHYRPFSR